MIFLGFDCLLMLKNDWPTSMWNGDLVKQKWFERPNQFNWPGDGMNG